MKLELRPIALVAILTAALMLAACSTAPPANVEGLRRVVGTDLIGARGLTPTDNRKIGRTVAAICAGGVWTESQCREHDEAIKPTP